MNLKEAIEAVKAGKVQRVCAPVEWRVWRDENGTHLELMR